MKKISMNPPKGTYDLYPEDFAVRKYIFDNWRKVCTSFGYLEYLGPLVENCEIWKAKSGEDVGGSELTKIIDKSGNISQLAIRPEMTPTVTRMVSRIYKDTAKPIRYFSIANFYRNERPQRGRNREFWQLNFDLFGSNSIYSDVEVVQLALEIMLSFNPPENSFKLFINNRKIINYFLDEILGLGCVQKTEIVRIMDKWKKLNINDFIQALNYGGVSYENIENIIKFLQIQTLADLIKVFPRFENNAGFLETKNIYEILSKLGYENYIGFDTSMIRGFDYYDGLIFEVFDLNPQNTRSMFGGGRYNGLSSIFGVEDFPAVGSAPGDETIKLFLESWKIIPKIENDIYYIPLLKEELFGDVQKIAFLLRQESKLVETGIEVKKLGKQFEYANKRKFKYVVIYGEEEKGEGLYKVKNMSTGEEIIKIGFNS